MLQPKLLITTVLTLVFSLISITTCAQELNTNENGIMAHGYDLISYFEGTPTKGSSKFSTDYNGSFFYFSSNKNLQRFNDNPDLFLPMFGGYCAYGVRMGKKFDTDPMTYAIEDQKLFFLLNRSTKMIWENDRLRNITIAKRIWDEIKYTPVKSLDSN